MPLGTAPGRFANKADERVSSFFSTHIRTRLVGAACAIHLARRDAGKAHTGTFLTPYRTVTIPYACWSAGEFVACGHYRCL